MARRPPDDPRVTDLRRYRKQRQEARRRPPRPRGESFLGSNPRAGLILMLVVLALVAMWALPRFL